MRKRILPLFGLAALVFLYGFCEPKAPVKYELAEVHPVVGRQGICTEKGYYWVSGSGTLAKYDSSWKLIAENTEPFEGYTLEVNHIGDIDVYDNELYLGVEYFMDGEGRTYRSLSMMPIRSNSREFFLSVRIPGSWSAAESP